MSYKRKNLVIEHITRVDKWQQTVLTACIIFFFLFLQLANFPFRKIERDYGLGHALSPYFFEIRQRISNWNLHRSKSYRSTQDERFYVDLCVYVYIFFIFTENFHTIVNPLFSGVFRRFSNTPVLKNVITEWNFNKMHI